MEPPDQQAQQDRQEAQQDRRDPRETRVLLDQQDRRVIRALLARRATPEPREIPALPARKDRPELASAMATDGSVRMATRAMAWPTEAPGHSPTATAAPSSRSRS